MQRFDQELLETRVTTCCRKQNLMVQIDEDSLMQWLDARVLSGG